MKTISMNRMQMQMCCCCCSSKQMMRNDKEKRDQHIINNIYIERQHYEKISFYDSIAYSAAS